MQRRGGFTLVEMAIAVFIMLLLLAVAIPSLRGVLANRRLKRSLDEMNNLVREAQEKSLSERRPYLIVWEKDALALRPEELEKDETNEPTDVYAVRKGDVFQLDLPAALQKKPLPQWIFWPSGNCEPSVVSFHGPDGVWSAKYSALTTQPEIIDYAAK